MSDDLLPCPFCGGAVDLERAHTSRHEFFGERQWWGVKCRNTLNLGGTCAIEAIPSASPEAAIERWNRRAPTAAVELSDDEIRQISGKYTTRYIVRREKHKELSPVGFAREIIARVLGNYKGGSEDEKQ